MRIGLLVAGAVFAPMFACAQSLDTSFGTGGQFTLEMTGGSSYLQGYTQQADGKVVAVGNNRGRINLVVVAGPPSYAYEPAVDGRDVLVARVLSNGTLDSSFGVNGVATIDFHGRDDRGVDVALQPDGKLLVVARAGVTSTNYDVGLIRLNSDGSLDTSFNATGKVSLSLDGTDDRPTAMVLQPDGAVVIIGNTTSLVTASSAPTAVQSFAIRVRSDGTLDSSFGTTGKTLLGDSNDHVSLLAAARQVDGKIVAAGLSNLQTPRVSRQIAVRFTSSGLLDSSFGLNGVTSATGPLFGAFVATTDTITVYGLGTAANPLTSPATRLTTYVTRYTSEGNVDTTFGTSGSTGGHVPSTQDYPGGVVIEPSGKILVGGSMSNNPPVNTNVPGPVQPFVARLLTSGNIDTTFGTNGVFVPSFSDAATQTRSGRLLRTTDGKLQLIGHTGQATSAGFTFGEVIPDSQRGFILQLNSSPSYAFSGAAASIREDQGSLQLAVTRTGNTNGNVSVRVRTSAQSASATTDFTPLDTVLTWTPQDAATKTVTLNVTNDTTQENDEQLTVTLSEPSEGSIGNSSAATVTITDDDTTQGGGGISGGSGGGGGGGAIGPFVLALLLGPALLSRAQSWRLGLSKR